METLYALRAKRRLLAESRLALRAEDSASWANFVNGGKGATPAERASRRASLNAIELEIHRLDTRIANATLVHKSLRARTMLDHLAELLGACGQAHLMDEAAKRTKEADAQLTHAAMQEAAERAERDTALRISMTQQITGAT